MALPKTGRYGKLKVPINNGIQFSNLALTKEATKTIGGKVFANRFHDTINNFWNGDPAYKATWRLQGIAGEASISPASGNDAVQTPAISYFKDNSSPTPSTAAADTNIALGSRPASGKAAQYLILLDLDDGTMSISKGADISGTTAALLDTYGSEAGKIPLAAVDKLIVGLIKTAITASQPVTAEEITYVNGAGVLLQERSDIPGGKENLLEGGVLFDEALQACHTGAIPRVVYATFYSQKTVLADVADLINWKQSITRGLVSMPGKGDNPATSEISSTEAVTGSAAVYMCGRKMFDLFRKGAGYVQLFQDTRDTASYYEGAAIWSSFDENNDEAAIVNNINFSISGFIERRGTE